MLFRSEFFLSGALGFAKGLGRTLVIPPWIEYRYGHRGSVTVPFDSYFNVSRVRQFHKAITMEDFFSRLAERVWPQGSRLAFCYMARRGPEPNSCNAKDGNPFGPFWDTFGVTFDGSQTYGPLSYDVHHHNAAEEWRQQFPADQYPVLAFTGAPASFPVQEDNLPLQQYLVFNAFWEELAQNWVRKNMPPGPFIGVHLRNGLDWTRACEHTASTDQLFSSPQCLGYRNERGRLTTELCAPDDNMVAEAVEAAVRKYGALSVYVASDNDHMLKYLGRRLGQKGLSSVRLLRQEAGGVEEEPAAHLDLAILARSNYFIANCVSSFSAFVKRTRDVEGLPSGFWGYNSSSAMASGSEPREEL